MSSCKYEVALSKHSSQHWRVHLVLHRCHAPDRPHSVECIVPTPQVVFWKEGRPQMPEILPPSFDVSFFVSKLFLLY